MIRIPFRTLLTVVLLVISCLPSTAQETSNKRFVMQKIRFKGSRLFKDEQLLAGVGMKVGGSYTQQELQDFANKLSSTGLFSQVAYRYTPFDAEYDLTDASNLLSVRFENCVWMSDEQLLQKLKERLPLFVGVVPQEGTLAEEVGAKMEGILAEQGVKAKVQFMAAFDSHNALSGMAYTVVDPQIQIAAIHFADAAPDVNDGLVTASKKSIGKDYTTVAISAIVDSTLMPVLQEKGYLRGYFGATAVKLVTTMAENPAKVELTVPVHEGDQYTIAGFTMKGDDPIAKDAAKQLANFKTGDVANMVALKAKFSTLGAPYLAKGYMAAKVKAEPNFDDAAHKVAFTVEMLPGDQYKLSKLEVQGIDDAMTEKLMKVWQLKVGDPYDATYARNFFNKENAPKLLFLNGYGMAWTQKIHDDSKTVELTVFFRKRTPQGQ